MSLFRWICFAPRRPDGSASSEPPPLREHEVPQTTTHQFLSWSHAVSLSPDQGQPSAGRQQKWLPVIDTDRCIGCERCLAACEHGCLEMIWSFSTLTNPQNCCGEGHCVESCPEQIIHMDWIPVDTAVNQPSGKTAAL